MLIVEHDGTPLNVTTLTKKRREYGIHPLIKTGDLLREAGEYQVQGRQLAVLYGIEYAKFHQEGTRTIPQRKFIPSESLWYTKNVEKSLSKIVRKMQL